MSNRPSIVVITRNFPPLWGGMERLNWHLVAELVRKFQVKLVSITGAAAHAPKEVVCFEARAKPILLFLASSAVIGLWQTIRTKPKCVLGGSALVAPFVWLSARLCRANCCIYTHGLDVTFDHPIYKVFWRPFIRRMDLIIANSRSTAEAAMKLGVQANRIQIVHPGVSFPSIDSGARTRFRQKYNFIDQKLLLSVGRLTERKGLLQFIENSLPLIRSEVPDVCLVIVGDVPVDSLAVRHQTVDSIISAAKRLGLDGNVRFIGKLFGEDLSDAYSAADIHVFPVRQLVNDPEGFGMVAVEAAAHGLPTVAFSTGGVVDAVAQGISGYLCTAGDYEEFARVVIKTCQNDNGMKNLSREFAKQFEWSEFGKKVNSHLINLSSRCQP